MAPRQTYGSIAINNEDPETATLFSTSAAATTGKSIHRKKYWAIGGMASFTLIALTIFTRTSTKHAERRQQLMAFATTRPLLKDVLSELSPVDLGFRSIRRAEDASPASEIWGNQTGPLPTNAWYLNLVSHKAAQSPDEGTRAYTIPYIIDMSPPDHMAGIRVHWPVVSASDRNIQMIDDFKNGLCFGAAITEIAKNYQVDPKYPLSHLGVSLQWQGNDNSTATTTTTFKKLMSTHIVRGMPYATIQYFGGALPLLYSYNGPASGNSSILVDGKEGLECGTIKGKEGNSMTVQGDLEVHFQNSDFTWGVYFSKPVQVRCDVGKGDPQTRDTQLSVVSYDDDDDGEDDSDTLTVRVSLLNECTTGQSNIQSHCKKKDAMDEDRIKKYATMMRESAAIFPTSPQLRFSYPESESTTSERTANVTIDWKATTYAGETKSENDLLMFTMPHHQEALTSTLDNGDVKITDQCVSTFHGKICLVRGDLWTLSEDLGPPMSFNAPRPPQAEVIPTLASALAKDIHYRFSDNMMRAAADTYFPGKILARLGRVIAIADEMKALADSAGSAESDSLEGIYTDADDKNLSKAANAAASENLPSKEDFIEAVQHLKLGVQVWLSEDAEAPFVFDKSWGGLVSCGCRYVGNGPDGYCNNTFPDCPALASVNEDFGNGYYSDHHYHYGYHLYAAAVVAKFDSEWAEEYFEKILLYVRDFANPSAADEYFPQFRQKDWFLGSSWASGIVSAENSPHGRNEESSSEAISAYEAMTLYGSVMVDVFSKSLDEDKLKKARLVRDAGQLLTATELRATNRYWHVWSSDDHKNVYPKAYKQPVVGMLYDTMASFQTWFSPYAVVSYGIQLMPFTPVAEERDDTEWATELYPRYKEACESAGKYCVDNGWSILQAGLYAETGNMEGALDQLLAISPKVFESLGGMGNSLSNMVWFISTRKSVGKNSHSS